MNSNPYKPGRRVYWNDPDNGACSAAGVIVTGISDEDYADMAEEDLGDLEAYRLRLLNDAGGEIECTTVEVELSCASNGIHDGLTFGFGSPDAHGYFDIGDPVAARAAEKRDNQPVGTYWPFH
jgi:hypothetical protein